MKPSLVGTFAGIVAALLLPAALSCAAEPSVFFRNYVNTATVHPDGLYENTLHIELQATNDSAAKEIAQQSVPFSESLQKAEIVEAYTLKADGRKLPVDTKAIFPQAPPGSPQIPMFNDQKLMMLVFPDVIGGDTVVYTVNYRQLKPYFPGQFTMNYLFPKTIVYKNFVSVVTVPKSLPLYTEEKGVSLSKKTGKDTIEYRWTYSTSDPVLEDVAAVSPFDRLPRVSASTFRNTDAMGRAYAALAAAKTVVTPKVQAQADQITAGIGDRRLQAKAIYEWVSRHVRYVAIFLSNGGLIPHDPDTILANGYGDCKDHTVLFASLLKAKGIASDVVLINLDNAYTLPDVGVLGPLNHAISWLPEFGIYADTTAAVAPFGTLPIAEYGKPVVHAVTSGRVMHETPVLPAGAYDSKVETASVLGADGRITGTTVMTASSAPSTFLRAVALQIQSAGPERAAKSVLKGQGLEGSGTFEFSQPTELSPTYGMTAHFQIEPDPAMLSGERFAPPVGMKLLDRPGVTLMGPAALLALSDSEPTACFSGHQLEILTLDLPPGKRPVQLPNDRDIKTDNLHFTSHWTFAGSRVTVKREFSSSIDEPLCTGKTRVATADALKQIRVAYREIIWLNPN